MKQPIITSHQRGKFHLGLPSGCVLFAWVMNESFGIKVPILFEIAKCSYDVEYPKEGRFIVDIEPGSIVTKTRNTALAISIQLKRKVPSERCSYPTNKEYEFYVNSKNGI